MKNRFITMLFSLMMIALAFTGASALIMEAPLLAGALTVGGLISAKMNYGNLPLTGVFKNGVQVEIWQEYIAGNLFKANPFMSYMRNADSYVLMGKVVHIPQAGSKANTVKNRSTLPAAITSRTDTDRTYPIDEYTTDPVRITNAEKVELSYDKIDSVLGDHREGLDETVGDNILITVAPSVAGQIIRTSGSAVTAHMTNGTGNRKAFTEKDLRKAKVLLNKQNVPKEGRVCVMSEDMAEQFIDSLSVNDNRDFSRVVNAKEGVVGRLHGFDIITRPDVVAYNAGATAVNVYGATLQATDQDAVLCWHPRFVERALGTVKFFENVDDPTNYGDVYSALVRFGGAKVYDNERGIVAIVQDNA